MQKIAFSDLRVLSMLPSVLASYIEPQDLEKVIGAVREGLSEGYQRPSAEALWATVTKCRRCPNRSGNPELPMWNMKDPKVLFVTEKMLSMKGSVDAFMGAAKDCNFSSSEVCLTQMVRCPFQDKHTDDDLERCSEYIWTEIVALAPDVIVPMGVKVSSYFIPIDKLEESRGKEVWIGPWRFVPTFSPDYVAMSNSDKIKEEFHTDMKKIRSLVP